MGVAYNPAIVTSGLVLCLDAGNTKSYPGSGTTWTDLSGVTGISTLINGPTFDITNGGSIVFDGVNDYISTNLGTYTPYCIDIWFYNSDDITSAIIAGPYQQLVGVGTYPGGISLGSWTGSATDETFCMFSSNWTTGGMTYIKDNALVGNHNLVVNWNGSTYDFWLDGTKRTTYASTVAAGHCVLQSRTGLEIGRDFAGVYGYDFRGKVYSFKMYTSQLTDSQIQQNFNCLRGRFGI